MNELALFAGAGGGILGGKLLGWRTVCAVELDKYAASVLVARQNDGTIEPFPIWDDIRTFDGRPWRGRVDVVSGGFPCQDISIAGKGAGVDGERSGLWSHMARIIGEVRPRFVLVENSPMLVGRGLTRVLSDLASMGYDARWGVVGAHHVGAPHKRDRLWLVGFLGDQNSADHPHTNGSRESQPQGGEQEQRGRTFDMGEEEHPHTNGKRGKGEQPRSAEEALREESREGPIGSFCDGERWWATEPAVGRMAHGVACRMDRIRAIGNGQVPSVAALAWKILTEQFPKPRK